MLMGEAAGEAAAMAITRRPGTGGGTVTPSASPGSSASVAPTASPTVQPLTARVIDVQRIDVSELQARLRAHGSYLVNPVPAPAP